MMFSHDLPQCCFGVHIWRLEITPTFGENGYQDGAIADFWCIICGYEHGDNVNIWSALHDVGCDDA